MKKNAISFLILSFITCFSLFGSILIDHEDTDITTLTQAEIDYAKSLLHIAYGHTSHGSQVTDGMSGLVAFANGGGLGLSLESNTFAWNNGGSGGALDLHDYAMGGDCGYYPDWVNNTTSYLDNQSNSDVNVIIWSWCGQVDSHYASGVLDDYYLDPMNDLESQYPHVVFVYMTGHVDHWDDTNNKAANQMIRDYCAANNKVLYDFADIESYDPDGTYYEYPHDNCDYYAGSGGSAIGNWAEEWRGSHTEGVDWYSCGAAHSDALNANQKAYAAWHLWVQVADRVAGISVEEIPPNNSDPQNFGNSGVTIQFNGGNGGTTLTVSQLQENPGIVGELPAGVNEICQDQFWHINSSNGNVGNYDITLDLSGIGGIADYSILRLLKRDNAGSEWQDMGLPSNISGAPSAVVWSGLNGFSDFAIGNQNGETLPLELSSFSAQYTSEQLVTLQWATHSESNLIGYNILRSNNQNLDDAIMITPGYISAANEATGYSYRYTDQEQLIDGVYYYWLQSWEYSNEINYYGPLAVNIDNSNPDDVPDVILKSSLSQNYPNPFFVSSKDNQERAYTGTTITFSIKEGDQGQLDIFNLKGEIIKSYKNLNSEDHEVFWNGKTKHNRFLGSGVYFYRLTTDTNILYKRMLLLK